MRGLIYETDWLQSDDPDVLFQCLLHENGHRKRWLYGYACCRLRWDELPDDHTRRAIEFAERVEDDPAPVECLPAQAELRRALQRARLAAHDACKGESVPGTEYATGLRGPTPEQRRQQAALVRDIFGNPFRPVEFDPRWRTADVMGLARAIYEDRAFDRLPLLADALMDAGCADEQVTGHCRAAGPHVRGCWVVDLVLEMD
jgi:hypothetical protein